MALLYIAAALVVVFWPTRWRDLGINDSQRTLLLSVLALCLLVGGSGADLTKLMLEGKTRGWNFFHYYLGSKYFAELGYDELYRAVLAADEQTSNRLTGSQKLRDLRTYEIVSRSSLPPFVPEAAFTQERWDEFKTDVDRLLALQSPASWRNVVRDRGYNGTPVWTVVGSTLSRWLPPTRTAFGWIAAIDVLLLTSSLLLVVRTFGLRSSVAVVLLFAASPTNIYRMFGGFLQHDWLFALVVSVCCYRSRRPALAGAAMAYALMTRVFPVAFVLGLIFPVAVGLLRRRSLSPAHVPPHVLRFLASLLLGCGFLWAASLANGRGIHAWTDFVDAIGVHREHHVLGDRRLGLEPLTTGSLEDGLDPVSDGKRATNLAHQRPLYLGLAAGLVGLFVIAARRARTADSFLLGSALVFAGLTLSRYYFAFLALLPLWTGRKSGRLLWKTTCGGQLAAFLGYELAVASGADRHTSYLVLNALLAIYFFILLFQSWLSRCPIGHGSGTSPGEQRLGIRSQTLGTLGRSSDAGRAQTTSE